jgi:glycosyltransferase involved in cell wall biosynthesis
VLLSLIGSQMTPVLVPLLPRWFVRDTAVGSVRPVTRPAIDIVLPCLDEALALPWVLERIPYESRAIVVDNGSTDGSTDVARSLGAMVVECQDRGYGAACHAGLEAATAEFVAFCDCDGTLDPRDLTRMLAALERDADLVVCRRRPVSRSAWPWPARVANIELARRVRKRTSTRIQDVGPLRIARREPLLALNLTDRRSGYPVETVVRAADAGWRIGQVDVEYRERIGRSKVTGTLRGSLQAFRDMSAVLSA